MWIDRSDPSSSPEGVATLPRTSLIGVVGGLGPLASAEFVREIYQHCRAEREQDLPSVALLSDPTFPDRTTDLLAGRHEELLSRLSGALAELRRMGAANIVICCVTIHHLLDQVPPELRAGVLSLLDVVFVELARLRRPHLLLCTTGTRRLRTFERHPSWARCQEWMVLPDERDQDQVHQMIYRLKVNRSPADEVPALNRMMDAYGVRACVAGCTELHLVAGEYSAGRLGAGYTCLDPLTLLASRLSSGGGS